MALPPLLVEINGDSSGLDRALGRAGAGLKKLGVAAGVAAGAVVGSLAAMTVAGIKAGVEINILAQRSNATPEAFQRMAAGARTVGIDTGKMSDILQDVNDRIGDFLATGAGPMADFFENIAPKIGVTIDQFKKLSGPEALQLFATSLERAGLNQQEMTFYMESMASDATMLIPLLRDGGRAMTEFGDAAQASGNILSESMIQAIIRVNLKVSQIGSAFTSLQLKLASELAPTIDFIASKFSEFAKSDAATQAIDKLVSAFGQLAKVIFSEDFMSTALGAFEGLISLTAGAASGLVFVAQNLEIVTAAAVVATGVLALMGGPITLAVAAATLAVAGISILVGRIRDTFGSVGEALSLVGDVVAEVFDRMSMKAGAWSAGLSATVQDVNSAFFGMVGAIAESVASAVGAVTSGVAAMINAAISGFETLINKAVQGVNSLVAGLNKIPGIAIEALSPFSAGGGVDFSGATSGIDAISERISGMKAEAGASAEALRGLAGQLTDMSGAPLASMEALRAAMSVDTGQSPGPDDGSRDPLVVTPIIPGVPITPTAPGTGTGGGGGGGPTAGVGSAGAVTDEMQARLDALTQGMMTEAETVQEWYEAGDETLRAALDAELITRAEYDEQKLRLEAEHQEKLGKIKGQEMEVTKNVLDRVAGLMQTSNAKLFKIGQAAAIARATISGYEAAVESYKYGAAKGGPVLGAALAAVSLAQTGAMIASIASQSPSGSGGGGGGGSAGGASAATAPPQAPLEARVTGFGANDLFNGSMVTSLFNKLQDEAGDRGLRVSFAT